MTKGGKKTNWSNNYHLELQRGLSMSAGQMLANRPADGQTIDLEWEEFYCPGKRT